MGRHKKDAKYRLCELCLIKIDTRVWATHRRTHGLTNSDSNRGRKHVPSPLSKPGYRVKEA